MATVRIDSLIKSIATALDIVEGTLLGASTNHGKRIAVLCAKMAKIYRRLCVDSLLRPNIRCGSCLNMQTDKWWNCGRVGIFVAQI